MSGCGLLGLELFEVSRSRTYVVMLGISSRCRLLNREWEMWCRAPTVNVEGRNEKLCTRVRHLLYVEKLELRMNDVE